MSEPAAPDVAQAPSDARERARRFVRSFLTLRWVPLTAALLSLPLSAAAILLSVQQPEVLLILPDQIRVAQGRSTGGAYVYLQPAFVSTGRNERVEVIRDISLHFEGPGGPADFSWSQVLRLVTDPETGGLSYQYEADAVPLLVDARKAAAPLSLFNAPAGWFFSLGEYRVSVRADRVVTGQPLSEDFTFTLSQADIDVLEQPGGDRFVTLPITP